MAKKASFIVFYDLEEHLRKLTDAQVGQVFRAMFAYEKRGEEYSGSDPAVELAMEFITGSMDRNRAKYEEICLKRSAAGKKGGAPEGNQNARKHSPQPENKQNKQKQTKQPDSERERERVPDHEPDPEPVPDSERARDSVTTDTVVTFFREHIHKRLTWENKQTIQRYCEEMGCEKVMEAMRIAEQNGVKGWNYCEGILKNWKEEAQRNEHGGGAGDGSHPGGRWAGKFDKYNV